MNSEVPPFSNAESSSEVKPIDKFDVIRPTTHTANTHGANTTSANTTSANTNGANTTPANTYRTSMKTILDDFRTRVIALLTSWVVYFTLRGHDFWLWNCNQVHEFYCQILRIVAKFLMQYHKRRLLYAYLDQPAGAENTSAPIDITAAVSAYYAVDTILSCYTLQEWLKRCDINVRYVNLVYIRDIYLLIARLDLDADVETINNEPSDANLASMPSLVLYVTSRKPHNE
jgi:hypothetical protein